MRVIGVAAVLALVSIVAGCSSGDKVDGGDVAGAYSEVVRWFVEASEDDSDQPRIVFVASPRDDLAFDLGTQLRVVESSEDFAEVRFIDDRSEAIDADGAVRDGGLFLVMGPALEAGTQVEIECERVVSETTSETMTFTLDYTRDVWVVRGQPTPTSG